MGNVTHNYGNSLGLLLVVLINFCYSNGGTKFGEHEFGICPSDESKFRELDNIPIRDCVKYCAVRPSCKVAGYKRRYKTCSLHYRTPKELASYESPGCVQIKMETVDLAQHTKGCNCTEWTMCNTNTNTCEPEECEPLQHSVIGGTVLGNIDSPGSLKRVQCIESLSSDQPDDKFECQNTGNWSTVPKCVGALVNIALNKPAFMSSLYQGRIRRAHLGVDGNTNQYLITGASCFHTDTEHSPWWEVDVEILSYMEYVRLYNRLDRNYATRAHDIAVTVGKGRGSMHQVHFIQGILPPVKDIQMPPDTYARIFKLTIQSLQSATDILHLCEIEIYGYAVETY